MEKIKSKAEDFNNDLMKIPGAQKLADMTNVPIIFFPIGLVSICVVLVALNVFSAPLVTLVSVAYPAFKSCLALETEAVDDDKQWLTYWMVFGLFTMVDQSFGFVLHYLPFYFLIKLFIMIWLQNPVAQGALVVYTTLVQPFARKHKTQIDFLADESTRLLTEMGQMVTGKPG